MKEYTSGEILHCGRKPYLVKHFLPDGHDAVLGIVDDLAAHSTGHVSKMNCPRTDCVAPSPAPLRLKMMKVRWRIYRFNETRCPRARCQSRAQRNWHCGVPTRAHPTDACSQERAGACAKHSASVVEMFGKGRYLSTSELPPALKESMKASELELTVAATWEADFATNLKGARSLSSVDMTGDL